MGCMVVDGNIAENPARTADAGWQMRMRSDVVGWVVYLDGIQGDQAWLDVVEVHREIGTRDDETLRAGPRKAEQKLDVAIQLHRRCRYASTAVPVPDRFDEVPWLPVGVDDFGHLTMGDCGVAVVVVVVVVVVMSL